MAAPRKRINYHQRFLESEKGRNEAEDQLKAWRSTAKEKTSEVKAVENRLKDVTWEHEAYRETHTVHNLPAVIYFFVSIVAFIVAVVL